MRRLSTTNRAAAFSLIEVVLAVALLAFTIVAVVGLIGLTGRSVSDVQDFTTAARISDAVQEEFQRMGFDQLVTLPVPITLYGNGAGDRVVLSSASYAEDPERGIVPRDRYYDIRVTRAGGQLAYNPNYSGFVALRVEVRWPHNIPSGPGPNDFQPYSQTTDEESRQRIAVYHIAVPRR